MTDRYLDAENNTMYINNGTFVNILRVKADGNLFLETFKIN